MLCQQVFVNYIVICNLLFIIENVSFVQCNFFLYYVFYAVYLNVLIAYTKLHSHIFDSK